MFWFLMTHVGGSRCHISNIGDTTAGDDTTWVQPPAMFSVCWFSVCTHHLTTSTLKATRVHMAVTTPSPEGFEESTNGQDQQIVMSLVNRWHHVTFHCHLLLSSPLVYDSAVTPHMWQSGIHSCPPLWRCHCNYTVDCLCIFPPPLLVDITTGAVSLLPSSSRPCTSIHTSDNVWQTPSASVTTCHMRNVPTLWPHSSLACTWRPPRDCIPCFCAAETFGSRGMLVSPRVHGSSTPSWGHRSHEDNCLAEADRPRDRRCGSSVHCSPGSVHPWVRQTAGDAQRSTPPKVSPQMTRCHSWLKTCPAMSKCNKMWKMLFMAVSCWQTARISTYFGVLLFTTCTGLYVYSKWTEVSNDNAPK